MYIYNLFAVIWCDLVRFGSGAWSETYNEQNILRYGGRCYCTAEGKNANINLVFCHETNRPFWLSSFMVVAPTYGFVFDSKYCVNLFAFFVE
jgi:hypothetical protein